MRYGSSSFECLPKESRSNSCSDFYCSLDSIHLYSHQKMLISSRSKNVIDSCSHFDSTQQLLPRLNSTTTTIRTPTSSNKESLLPFIKHESMLITSILASVSFSVIMKYSLHTHINSSSQHHNLFLFSSSLTTLALKSLCEYAFAYVTFPSSHACHFTLAHCLSRI